MLLNHCWYFADPDQMLCQDNLNTIILSVIRREERLQCKQVPKRNMQSLWVDKLHSVALCNCAQEQQHSNVSMMQTHHGIHKREGSKIKEGLACLTSHRFVDMVQLVDNVVSQITVCCRKNGDALFCWFGGPPTTIKCLCHTHQIMPT